MNPQNPAPPVTHAHTPALAPGVYCTANGEDTTNNPLKPCVYQDSDTFTVYRTYEGYRAPGEFLACSVVFAVAFILVAAMRRWEATPARTEEREHYRQLAKKHKRELRRHRKRYYYHEYQDTKRPPKSHDNPDHKTTK